MLSPSLNLLPCLPRQPRHPVKLRGANQVAFDLANAALQIYGGYGYGSDSPIQYLFRKTRGWMIAGGSIEVQKNNIAAHVFGRRFSQRLPKQP